MKPGVVSTIAASAGALLFVTAFSAAGQTPAPAAPSAKAGKGVYERDGISCHTVDTTSEAAPTLKGIAGRRVGSMKFAAASPT